MHYTLRVPYSQPSLFVVLPQAATGESIGEEELGGADVHCGISGCADHYAWSEEEALETTRAIVSSLNLPTNTARRACSPGTVTHSCHPLEQTDLPHGICLSPLLEPPLYPAGEEEFACLVPPHGFQDWPVMEACGAPELTLYVIATHVCVYQYHISPFLLWY